MPIYNRLTDRTLATGVTLNDLIHIVITGDTTQSPEGSSFKATVQQLANVITGSTGSGTSGSSGTSGANGTSGSSGTSGANGTSGSSGTSGTSPVSPFPYVYGLYSQTSNSAVVSGTTSETSIIGSGVGTLTVPANGFTVGDSFTATMMGHIGANNNDDLTIRVKSGSATLGTIGPINLSTATDQHFKLDLYFTIRVTGTTGVASIMAGGSFSYSKNAGGAFESANFTNQNNTTFDTTTSNTLVITAQFDSTNAANAIYSEIFVLNKTY